MKRARRKAGPVINIAMLNYAVAQRFDHVPEKFDSDLQIGDGLRAGHCSRSSSW
jgi:hypothetical protein